MLRTRQFGAYEIVRKLGRGMTDVYLGYDALANRPAVLKIVEESPDSLTQLVLEAERRGAAIQKELHELDSRVLEIYEYGDLDGCFFVAMEYAEGRNVAEILRQEKRLEPRRAAQYALEICDQLARLHSFVTDIDGHKRAVVHGDIKPSNIQIGPNEEVRLLDFGIAKAITFTHNLTHHDLGSPSYCSPERLSRGQVDHHTDLWALAVTLHEMVAGTPPYQAQNTRKLESLIQSRRPPRALPDDCPPALRAIINKALAGELHSRYASAAALAQDLQLFLQSRPTRAEQEKRVSWHTNATIDRPQSEAEPRTWRLRRILGVLAVPGALVLGLLAGLIVLVPIAWFAWFWKQSGPLRAPVSAAAVRSDWDLFQRLRRENDFLGVISPVNSLQEPLRARFLATADEIIERYRNSSNPSVQDFDWRTAASCLQHAVELNPADMSAKGKLALCLGYVHLSNPQSAKSSFEQSASLLPRSPDPRLGLARLYVYAFGNVGKALAEFQEAQRLGFQLGPREMEQQADGYRIRAGKELAAARKSLQEPSLRLARRDLDRARHLYEPIAGFSRVSESLEELDQAGQAIQKLEDALHKPPPPKKRHKPTGRSRRWL